MWLARKFCLWLPERPSTLWIMKCIQLVTHDGAPLVATEFGHGERAILLAGATGVPQRFYTRFAQHLAGRGLRVLTLDYRGIGQSRAEVPPPDSMRSWAEDDLDAAIRYLRDTSAAVAVVGHSFGGQALGLCPSNAAVCALLGVSAQSGHWRLWDGIDRAWMWTMMHVVLPAILTVRRDVPGGVLGPDPLPGAVAREWARWCRGPHYIADATGQPLRDGFAQWTGQARLYEISDDHRYAPPRAVAELASFYARARVEIQRRTPQDWGVDRLGHFDFFRPTARAGWDEAADWLTSQLDQALSKTR